MTDFDRGYADGVKGARPAEPGNAEYMAGYRAGL